MLARRRQDRCGRLRGAWALLLAALAAAGALQCSQPLEPAEGSNQELSLFTPWVRDDDRVRLVRELLETPVVTAIRPERSFKVEVVEPRGLASRKTWRNLAFLADFREPGRLHDTAKKLLGRRLDAMVLQPVAWIILRDAWARGQTLLFLHVGDPWVLRDTLQVAGSQLLQALETAVVQGLEETLYWSGEQKAMEKVLEKTYGFTVRIPAGYKVQEDPENQTIRMFLRRPEGPAQFLVIHARPAREGSLDPDWALRFRDAVVVHYNEGDRVEFSRSRGFPTRFQGQEAVLLKGLWQNEKYDMGGAFESVLFFRCDRFFLIDGSVFYPTGDKLPYLRELRAIAATFRCRKGRGSSS
jgi:hypothetical protein